MKNTMSLKGETEKSLSFALTVLIFISGLDPFVQHVNTKLKEKENCPEMTNAKIYVFLHIYKLLRTGSSSYLNIINLNKVI